MNCAFNYFGIIVSGERLAQLARVHNGEVQAHFDERAKQKYPEKSQLRVL